MYHRIQSIHPSTNPIDYENILSNLPRFVMFWGFERKEVMFIIFLSQINDLIKFRLIKKFFRFVSHFPFRLSYRYFVYSINMLKIISFWWIPMFYHISYSNHNHVPPSCCHYLKQIHLTAIPRPTRQLYSSTREQTLKYMYVFPIPTAEISPDWYLPSEMDAILIFYLKCELELVSFLML